MKLVLDIGNKTIHAGVYEAEELLYEFSLKMDRHRPGDEYALLFEQMLERGGISVSDLTGAMACSVVSGAETLFAEVLEDHLQLSAAFVGPGVKTGLQILYDNPRDAGADRITNACAAKKLYGYPVIVCDIGTAVTFCYINELGQYSGGAILPGMEEAMETLAEKASRLPQVELVRPRRVIGRSTVEALQSGAHFGLLAQVEGMIHRIRREAGTEAPVVLTGMNAEAVARESRLIDYVRPHLTLEGLSLIYDNKEADG
ncbi:type III pantothenate kinase [Alkalicoccus urumqiensis]|uniref:type III pantothenate kinase n=1 Tax=Alkalicoccus urumqiensis TaxID=1548213 RepID=UPI0015E5B064|nr:type III pantothenate kinase [Alkalicoccus urumqiensis]